MPAMDVFETQAFSLQTLTKSLLDQPHIPRRIDELGLFESEGITTTDVSIEKEANTIVLVQTTPRGAPPIQNTRDGRDIFKIPTARIAVEDALSADEVQNVRAFGTDNQLRTLQSEVNRRNLRMSNNISVTEEFQRIGAIKGLVLDADGSTLFDPFTVFGVSQQTELDFDLDNASPAAGVLRKNCSKVIRLIEDELGSLPYSGIMAQCSSQFFDDLTAHPEYRANKLNFPDARELNVRVARRRTDFGGITFEEYRGKVGATKYVADDKAHFLPLDVPGLFLSRYAPAEFWDTVNTIGLPRYGRTFADPQNPDSRRLLRVQTQCLHICTRPRVLIPAKRT